MDHLLYGSNSEENIVAVHPASDQTMRVYSRKGNRLASDDVNFYPFFFLTNPSYLKNFEKRHWIKELEGDNPLRYIAAFSSWPDMWEGLRCCLLTYNETSEVKVQTFQELPVVYIRPDPVVQFLKQSGRTLFKKMKFNELHRIQIEIVTLMKRGSTVSNPERPEDQIVVVALSDNRGWQHIIHAKRKSEQTILTELVKLINQRDPDVIEGLFTTNYIIPYIMTRCRLHGIEATIGRDGSVPAPTEQRAIFSERSIIASSAMIAGRHVIDIHHLHESTAGAKHPHSQPVLKQLSRLCGMNAKPAITGTPQLISYTWENEPDNIISQSGETVSEILHIANRFLPPYFALAQMLPFNLAPVTRMNATSMTDSLILRNYIYRKLSLPRSVPHEQSSGDITEIFACGIYSPIIVLDVKAIISSLIFNENIGLENDSLNTHRDILGNILDHYNLTQKEFLECTDPLIRDELQSVHKASITLVDAAADHFLSPRSRFYDPSAVEVLFEKLRMILKEISSLVHSDGGIIIQTEVDGLFIVPPEGINTELEENKFINKLSHKLNSGLLLRISDRYKSMLSHRKKNYALLNYDGRISIHGTALISRTTEGFGKKFLSKSIEALTKRDVAHLHEIYIAFHKDILAHRFNISDYQRSETLNVTKEEYLMEVGSGKRHRTASFETAIRSGLEWSVGDKISYYVSGDEPNPRTFEVYKLTDDWDPEFPDENSAYYLKRLTEFAKKFEVFFSPQDFHSIFSAEDMFGFSPEGISIINSQTEAGEFVRTEEDSDIFEINPKIWLDL